MTKFFARRSGWVAIILLAFMLVVSLYTAWTDSNTTDEKPHIAAGYSYVKYLDMRLNPEHPPLIKDASGLALLLLQPTFPVNDTLWKTGINEQWTLGEKFIFASGNNADLLVFLARFPIILLSLALGWFIFFWAKKLAGPAAGLIALALYAFSPNILGHNHLVTTDLGIAAFIFFAFYFFIEFLKYPTFKNIILAGLFLALANLAKFSAVILFPIFGLLLILYAFVRHEKHPQRSRLSARTAILLRYLGDFAIIIVISFTLIWLYYIPHTAAMPTEKIHALVDSAFGGSRLVDTTVNGSIKAMSVNPVLKPLSQYTLGVAMVFLRVAGGNTTYFLGEVTRQSFKSYFPIIYLIKEPLPSLALIFAAFFWSIGYLWRKIFYGKGSFVRRNLKELTQYLRVHITEFSFIFFIVFYFILSIAGNLNLGFRHLFPIVPFVYLLTAKTLVNIYKRGGDCVWKIGKKAVLYLLFTWLVLENLAAFPLYLSYFNQIAEGSKNGYKYVVDSNTDWGQDLKRLQKWIKGYNYDDKGPPPMEPVEKIRVDYFGGSVPYYYLGDLMIPWNDNQPPESGWYAISATYLQTSIHQTFEDKLGYKWLAGRKPDYVVGNSILIFNIAPNEVPATQPSMPAL